MFKIHKNPQREKSSQYPNVLYNLETDLGFFKLKKVPLHYRIPVVVGYCSDTDLRLRWYYLPWHRYRVSPGETYDYVGGFTPKRAYENMLKTFGEEFCRDADAKRRRNEGVFDINPIPDKTDKQDEENKERLRCKKCKKRNKLSELEIDPESQLTPPCTHCGEPLE